ncbi:zinc metalloproteinase nas-26-like, partial [Mizuhopecten yessoensis]|uniref:zinc metalloproteinase nas-26-like n=1 Tax=Mizuhopecten yessoensis TaxID=6573 RepID=UPI000B45D7A9
MAYIRLYCFLLFAVCSIYGDVSGNAQLRNDVRDHLKLWPKKTMLYAIGSNYESDGWIFLKFDIVCYTEDVGENTQKRQCLYLADDCFNERDIVSLLVVTMGLYPEHQRPDRDQYIQVHMDNVQDGKYTRHTTGTSTYSYTWTTYG